MQIIPGTIQTIAVYDQNDRGYMLGDERHVVFLPKRDLRDELNEGDEIEVFTFYNEDQELEATTQLPLIQVGQMICIKAKNSNAMGAFVDIGTKRDILIPIREQREPIEAGQMVLMIMREDIDNRRLFGSTRISSNLLNKDMTYQRGDEVELTIAEKIEVGRRVVVNGKHFAALFDNEIMDKLHFGQKVKGYVRQIEGKDLVVSMQREGMELLQDAKDAILRFLKTNNGYARLNDDTAPDEIKLRLKMSKKTFKKAAGMLFKEGFVTLTKLGIKLNKDVIPQTEWVNTKLDENAAKTATPGRKQFVDKRNYKGRVNEFDERNNVLPRERIDEGRRTDDRGEQPSEERQKKVWEPRRNDDRGERKIVKREETNVDKEQAQRRRLQKQDGGATREYRANPKPPAERTEAPPMREPQRILKRRDQPAKD